MKKIFGYIAVLLVFSWVTTANAFPVVASMTSDGTVTVSGFGSGSHQNINFLFTYDASSTVNVLQALTVGQNDNIATTFTTTATGNLPSLSFSTDFNVIGQHNIAANSAFALATLFGPGGLTPHSISGSPLSTFTLGSNTLDLLSASFGVNNSGLAYLQLSATSSTLGIYLNHLYSSGSVDTRFHNELTVTDPPAAAEPTTMLLLLSAGLLGFGFSRKIA